MSVKSGAKKRIRIGYFRDDKYVISTIVDFMTEAMLGKTVTESAVGTIFAA